MMTFLQGPIPPRAPQDHPIVAAAVILLAVLAIAAVFLIRCIREGEAAQALVDALRREDERRRRSGRTLPGEPWGDNDA